MDEEAGTQIAGWTLSVHGGLLSVVQVLGLVLVWLFLVFSGLSAASAAISEGERDEAARLFGVGVALALMYSAVALPVLVYFLLVLAAGVLLLRQREWAVVPASVVAVLGLWMFPVGTLVAVVVLVSLWMPRLSRPGAGAVGL